MTTNNSTNNDRLTTNGQLLIGSTSASPVAATLTQGTGITITNGAGSITIASSASASALTWLASVTASSSATVDFANKLSATYDNYLIVFYDLVAATSGNNLWLRVGTGATPTWQSSSYNGANMYTRKVSSSYSNSVLAAGTTAIDITPNDGACALDYTANNSSNTSSGFIYIDGANSSLYKGICTVVTGGVANTTPTSYVANIVSNGQWQSSTVITSLRLLSSSGNIATGTFKLYGIQN